jgi:hypothetical protein
MVMRGNRGMSKTCHNRVVLTLTTHNAICISVGGIGSLHRNNRTVRGVARYIRHTTEPYVPWTLYVPPCREGTGAFTKEDPTLRRRRTANDSRTRRTYVETDVTYVRVSRRRIDVSTHKHVTYILILTDPPMPANATTVDGSDLDWRPYFGKVQRTTLNDAHRAVHRFNKTESGHLKVVMKIRPAVEINIKQLEVHLTRLGLAYLATLPPTNKDPEERLIACRSLDVAEKAVARTDWQELKQVRRVQIRADISSADKGKKAHYAKDKTLVNAVNWSEAFGVRAVSGERSCIILLPRVERDYEKEQTHQADRVIAFENYRGLEKMVDLVPQMAAQMRPAHTLTPRLRIPQQLRPSVNTDSQPRIMWMNSKAQTPEVHEANKANSLCYNAWFGPEMEPVEEDSGAAVEDIYDVLEGKGANGTKIAAYMRPGSKGGSTNCIAITFQTETVGPAYERCITVVLEYMAANILAPRVKREGIKLQWQDSDSNSHARKCMSTRSATGLWGVAPRKVTSDEVNDAVVAAGFAQPISIVCRQISNPKLTLTLTLTLTHHRSLKHPGKAEHMHVFFLNMGGQERAAARDSLMELKGLTLVQIERPSEEEAADGEVRSRMRDDGFLEIETFIPVEMLRTVWPAAASAALDPDKAYREIELPNWDATKVTLTLTLTLTLGLCGCVCVRVRVCVCAHPNPNPNPTPNPNPNPNPHPKPQGEHRQAVPKIPWQAGDQIRCH